MTSRVNIIGGGLAGSEAAWQVAEMGVDVCLHEMRPYVKTFAHQTGDFAEMVCSNSFRSDDHEQSAVGQLHWEMRAATGLIMSAADMHRLPAGGALAVDRSLFSKYISEKLRSHSRVTVVNAEVTALPSSGNWICATGPLTSDRLGESIRAITGRKELAFYDAIAPIVYQETIDMNVAWNQSRYDKGESKAERTAYINCPLSRDQYETFVDTLLKAEKTQFHSNEPVNYFDGCLPIEVMAERGRETLRFGPMKPVGLTNIHKPHEKPYAVVQLRRDNTLGTLYNIVGFQTKMKHNAQKTVFRTIPGLENTSFARLGGIHRNTFINSPKLLDSELKLNNYPWIRFAGQITGVEGYVESAAIGLIAGRLAAADMLGIELTIPPVTTATGALLYHITSGAHSDTFQPMNINFGLFPKIEGVSAGRKGRKERYKAYTEKAKSAWRAWLNDQEYKYSLT
ncbi:MAG: methylenetetrahydrofolate--tRNA-(uracil(54)-C(5))-methyltransferase (FADH(2)-oxidizing) TrmFO [Aestuariivita sp.]|nr:methylenetetrahydrofolate--tRNA-(uracil(54)-C(5))-methyltransferase (FADH(2)-oxidizing) TrmFO [Aestuariivita sp.]